jgi:hypothetical protein
MFRLTLKEELQILVEVLAAMSFLLAISSLILLSITVVLGWWVK